MKITEKQNNRTTILRKTFITASLICVACALFAIFSEGDKPLSHAMLPQAEHPDLPKMQRVREQYEQQLKEIDYYMRSHSLMDEGFDIVTRRRERLTQYIDSVTTLMDATSRFEAVVPYLVMQQSPYLYDWRHSRSDTVSSCTGNVVEIHYPDLSYYEGQYVDTLYEGATHPKRVRHGFGVAFSSDYVRAGAWQNDVYQGEQPLYTSNHIYGIDISRYQHEQPGKAKGKAVWKTVTTKVKVKGRMRTVTKKVKVQQPVSYPIDWNRLRITSLGTKSKKKIDGTVDYPISFVYIKSTEGVSIVNKYYLGDYVQSRRHGYKTGTYHFFSIKSSAVNQAMYFIKNSRYQQGDLPPVLDVEPTPSQVAQMGGARVLLRSMRQWLDTVERYLGVRPVIYVSQNFVNRYLTDRYDDGRYLKQNYHVWIARYGEYKPDVHLVFWQLCPDGRVAGIRFPVDINIFNGYADTFNEFVK